MQIADALIDNMRDLMVVKSAGAESELLVAGAEHRKHAGELAEMFDIAGLVYNITTLEKLRWTIKNSETARALLEASLLRLALSEHFLNVDSLLSQAPMGQAKSSPVSPIKKNEVTNRIPTSQPPVQSQPARNSQQSTSETDTGVDSTPRQSSVQAGLPQDEKQQRRTPINQAKTSSQRKNEIVNDPAVKTVLMELGATITGIEEVENQHET